MTKMKIPTLSNEPFSVPKDLYVGGIGVLYGGATLYGPLKINNYVAIPDNASTGFTLEENHVYLVTLMNQYAQHCVWIVGTNSANSQKTTLKATLVSSSYFALAPYTTSYGFSITSGGANGRVTCIQLV